MKTSDLICGLLLMCGGAIVYLTNYRSQESKGKMLSRAGLGILVVGTLIAFGQAILNQVFSGQ